MKIGRQVFSFERIPKKTKEKNEGENSKIKRNGNIDIQKLLRAKMNRLYVSSKSTSYLMSRSDDECCRVVDAAAPVCDRESGGSGGCWLE